MKTVKVNKVCSAVAVSPVQPASRRSPKKSARHLHESAATDTNSSATKKKWRRVFRQLVADREMNARASVVPLNALGPYARGLQLVWATSLSNVAALLAAAQRRQRKLTFFQTFGVLGPPMLFVVVVSTEWTAWLLVLAIAPTRTANFLMDTETYDDGRFWLIVDLDTSIVVLSATGLLAIAVGYLYILLKMLFWRNHTPSVRFLPKGKKLCWKLVPFEKLKTLFGMKNTRIGSFDTVMSHWRELAGFQGTHRKSWNLVLKAIDLSLQTLSLHQMLESGFPVVLIQGYASLIAVNSLSCVVFIFRSKHSAFIEVLVDSIFDLLFTMLFPILVLTHSYYNFKFDRAEYLLNMQVLPAGSFERRARMIADPAQIALFRIDLDSLRIKTLFDLLLRIGMNLSFCNRLKRVVQVLIARQKNAIATMTVSSESRQLGRIGSFHNPLQKPVTRSLALVFLLFSIAVVVYALKAVGSSQAICGVYPQCVVHAFRWRNAHLCPYLTLIDADCAPTTYEQWSNPVDATEGVKVLAASGDLRVLQLINRQFLRWPEELKKCKNVNYVSLIYTGTEEIPACTKGFKKLEYLHVEGKQGMQNILELSEDLFEDLPVLTFLQLGIHRNLQRIPPFIGVPNLSSLVFARLFSITRLPSFDKVKKLERLKLTYIPLLRFLPDMAPLKNLIHFAAFRPSFVCCNGFITPCDITDEFCDADDIQGLPAASCLTNTSLQASSATRKFFDANQDGVCQRPTSSLALVSDVPTKATIDMCDGVVFRECQLTLPDGANATGICYRSRMQALACSPDTNKITLRKLQIARKIGPVCDPVVKKWLGCGDVVPD